MAEKDLDLETCPLSHTDTRVFSNKTVRSSVWEVQRKHFQVCPEEPVLYEGRFGAWARAVGTRREKLNIHNNATFIFTDKSPGARGGSGHCLKGRTVFQRTRTSDVPQPHASFSWTLPCVSSLSLSPLSLCSAVISQLATAQISVTGSRPIPARCQSSKEEAAADSGIAERRTALGGEEREAHTQPSTHPSVRPPLPLPA